MDGMTGFDPKEAIGQLLEFDAHGREIAKSALTNIQAFNNDLYDNWTSPKAVEFWNLHLVKLYAIAHNVEVMYCQIYRSAVNAYNIIAKANGYSTTLPMYGGDREYHDTWLPSSGIIFKQYQPLVGDRNGVVGMNTANVKLALEVFNEKINGLIETLENTPMDIAFYDPDNSQKEAYKKEITKMIEDINSRVSEANSAMKSAIEEEVDTIMVAKEQATDTLSA